MILNRDNPLFDFIQFFFEEFDKESQLLSTHDILFEYSQTGLNLLHTQTVLSVDQLTDVAIHRFGKKVFQLLQGY